MAGSFLSRRRMRLAVTLALVASVLTALGAVGAQAAEPAADHLLVSEFVVTPTEGEFIEIHNPTDATIDLTDVYLTDATFAGGPT
ncbi:MAG: hypothetical protein QNL12_02610, partial [Acidimicrobiia bacterium]|nr:hypothetical protein [Acidimicrobiia bacterium]MDX2466180.1 hypothetical protein [Acidimicrobiia bacterium]